MAEPLIVGCPKCGQALQVPPGQATLVVRCPSCNTQVIVQAPPQVAPGPAPFQPTQPMGGSAGAAHMGNLPPESVRVTPRMVAALRSTRPWVFFLAILGFIGCGLMVGYAIVAAVLRGSGPREFTYADVVLGLVSAVLYFLPSFYLIRYGMAIKEFLLSGLPSNMENALEYQKSFWRYTGIVAVIFISIYLVLMIVVVLFWAGWPR